jgi:hypothetical protein
VGNEELAQNEYDSYIPKLIELLASGADRVKVADRLQRIRTESIGLGVDPDADSRIAVRLLEVYNETRMRR